MVKDNSYNFSFEGKSIPYSIRREIEYNGEETDVLMYWTIEESLPSGAFKRVRCTHLKLLLFDSITDLGKAYSKYSIN